jgi:hypothetical protein
MEQSRIGHRFSRMAEAERMDLHQSLQPRVAATSGASVAVYPGERSGVLGVVERVCKDKRTGIGHRSSGNCDTTSSRLKLRQSYPERLPLLQLCYNSVPTVSDGVRRYEKLRVLQFFVLRSYLLADSKSLLLLFKNLSQISPHK